MNKRRNILSLVTAAILVLIFVLYMITFVVREGEVAVLTTFGKVVRVIEGKPGLYWKAPPPIQRVVTFDARLHTEKDRIEETKTSDGVPIVVLAYYNWRIAEPEQFYSRLVTVQVARQKLGHLVRDAKDDVFGHHAFEELLPQFHYERGQPEAVDGITDDEGVALPADQRVPMFPQIEAEIFALVKDKALKEYGIEVSQIGIMRFELPEETTAAVIARMQSEREKEAGRIRARGEGEAASRRSKADADFASATAAAEAQARLERTEGEREAAEHYGVFALNEELHDFLLKLEALGKIIDEGTVLILSTDSEPFRLLQEVPDELLNPKSDERTEP